MSARAVLSEDRTCVTLVKGAWSETFGVDLLASRIRFYRSLCETPATKGRPAEPKPAAWAYLPTLAALEGVARVLRGVAA